MDRRWLVAATTVGALAAVAAGSPATGSAAGPTTIGSWTAPGEHAFTIPAGVHEITVTAIGAAGGDDFNVPVGGKGAYIQATLDVTPGQTFYAEVGGKGASMLDSGGVYGSAGAGGGASDIRTVTAGQPVSLNSRLLVAGGGGGAGRGTFDSSSHSTTGMIHGGDAGADGENAGTDGGRGGKGGTVSAGGAGGAPDTHWPNAAGANGQFGQGGAGGKSGVSTGTGAGNPGGYNGGGASGTVNAAGNDSGADAGGAGGGGGWWGGGGGGAAENPDYGAGGGGGGSSYAAPGSVTVLSGPTPSAAAASVTVTYERPFAAATTTPASAVTPTAAQLNATVDPMDQTTTYAFDYGTDTSYGSTLAGGTVGPSGGNRPVSAQLDGLQPSTTYHYRVVATTADNAVTTGNDQTFTTPATPPAEIDLGIDQAATPDPARVGEALTYTLQVTNHSGSDDATGVSVDDALPGGATLLSAHASQGTCSGSDTVTCAVGTVVHGAAATVTVTVRPSQVGTLVNTARVTGDQTDPAAGDDMATSRTTVRAAPIATTGSATDVATSAATLNGIVGPQGEATSAYFVLGTTTAYGLSTATAAAGSGANATAVAARVAGLAPGTTYHYRLVAANATGTSRGADHTFTTASAPVAAKPARVKAAGLSVKIGPRIDRHAPYRYTVKGRLSLPKGIARPAGCTGRVQVVTRAGRTPVSSRRATLGKDCRWKTVVRVHHPSALSHSGHGRLRVLVRFEGNEALLPLRLAERHVRYGAAKH